MITSQTSNKACNIGSATNLKYLRDLVRPPIGCHAGDEMDGNEAERPPPKFSHTQRKKTYKQ